MTTESQRFKSAFANTSTMSFSAVTNEERATLAGLREIFFSRDGVNIAKILRSDLSNYMDAGDAKKMRLVLMDEIIPAFLRKISNVYDVPPVYKFPEEGEADQEAEDALREFWNDLNLPVFFQENAEMMRFNNVSLALVKFSETLKKVFIDGTLHAGNSKVESFPDYVFEPKKLTYYRMEGKDKYAIVWELIDMLEDGTAVTEHYKYKMGENGIEPEAPEKIAIDSEASDLSGPPYWPVVVYRYSERGAAFWGNAMDSLVELVRAINVLFSVCNDDTIRQSIRILILNFDPKGVDNANGKIKTGMENPVTPEGQLGNNDPKGEILEAKLFNEDVINFVESLFAIVSNTHNIGSLLKQDLKESLSGIALKLTQAPLLRDWAHDINIVRQPDKELLSLLVRVYNYHGDKKKQLSQELADAVQVDYQEPNLVTDDKEEYELEVIKWKDGQSSPVLYAMAKNPEFTRDEAIDWIKKNLQDTEELTGLKITMPGQDEDEIINPPDNMPIVEEPII